MSFSRIKGIIFQNLYHFRHSLEDFIDIFFWPIIDLVVWGLMTNYLLILRGEVTKAITFLLGGLILWNIVWRAQQDISVSFLRNVWNRNILNLFISPLTPGEFIFATMILGIIRISLTLAAVTGLAFMLYSFNLYALGFLLIPFFINLLAFAWAVGIFVTGLIIRYGMRIQGLAWSFIAILNPLSAVFYPIATLPPIFQKIAWFLPSARIFEGMRQVMAEGPLPFNHLLWAFILNIVYIILAAIFFNFMYEKAREKGKLAKIEI